MKRKYLLALVYLLLMVGVAFMLTSPIAEASENNASDIENVTNVNSPESSDDICSKIIIKNSTEYNMYVAIHYYWTCPSGWRCMRSHYWVTEGWYKIPPGQEGQVVCQNHPDFYFYAINSNGSEWGIGGGLNQVSVNEFYYEDDYLPDGDEYFYKEFTKVVIPNENKPFYINLYE